jgi:NAD-dependent dihydropyrimidine dehydrogenase PreA subunit
MIPKEMWFPNIVGECKPNCGKCVDFCPKGVFELRDGQAVVVNPLNCIYLCNNCEIICPAKIIKFPPKSGFEVSASASKKEDSFIRVKCAGCGKIFLTDIKDKKYCFDCEGGRI